MKSPTPSQSAALAARGNVLLEAGAGAGKTSTLVARCVAELCAKSNPVSLDELLMVTFTEAAAAEMRRRIREALTDRAAREPANQRLAEQLALLDQARIGTLHSFCFRLVRDHFHELGLDPQSQVLDEGEARLLAA
jgi:ATP-dependent helicase/nuclease subunit A